MGKKIKKYKVGVESETYAISLVEFPAIESDFVALAKQEEAKVMLANDERHMVYGAVLIPDKDIYRCNHSNDVEISNTEQEFYINFTKESIAKMSQDFMKEYRQKEVTLDHEDIANEICVVESWLVEDPYKDKANALGINVPAGTWMVGMKVNNLEAWDRVKAGELKGFSVESIISLEEFSKEELNSNNNMDIKTDEMFWTTLKNTIKEIFSSSSSMIEKQEPTEIEPINENLEAEPQPKAEDAVVTPNVENNPIVENGDPAVVAPKAEDNPIIDGGDPKEILTPKAEEEPKVEEPEPKPQDNHLEELINNLKEEIAALKTSNGELQEKIKEMGKTPSAQPVNVNSKPSVGDTYSAWREQMRRML